MLEVKKTTQKFRVFAAGACLKILTPNFYEDVKDRLVAKEFPRPSTRIIHKIYGEKPLVGVEIGTGFGENALSLLHELSIERLYCIDPFAPYADGERAIQTEYLSRSECTLRVLSKFKNVKFIRKFSSEACEEIPENVDFVYVDGNHGYEAVLADLRNYFPLLHEKGVMAGHDLTWLSVRKAVYDFCTVNALTPILRSPDWIVIK